MFCVWVANTLLVNTHTHIHLVTDDDDDEETADTKGTMIRIIS